MSDQKPSNPKDAIGLKKLPLHLVSGVVKAYQAVAHYLGATKYGSWNYRGVGVRASVYVSALHRHIDKWWEGEEYDQIDGTPHLANALACINILIDAKHSNKLTDDRPPSIDLNPVYKELEGIMARIRTQYANETPRHYTIADTPKNDSVSNAMADQRTDWLEPSEVVHLSERRNAEARFQERMRQMRDGAPDASLGDGTGG